MASSLSNGLDISLMFGEAVFPLENNNRISKLHIVESVQLQIPQLTLELVDAINLIDKFGLQDGTPITISLSRQGTIIHTLTFRLFSYKVEQQNYVQIYTITGYLDIPKYWFGMAQASIRCTSTDALKQIANDCGLSFVGVPTSNSQLWMPNLNKYCDFAKYIADRGYASVSSCLVLGITLMKTMIYADIMNLASPSVVLRSYGEGAETDYLVSNYKINGYSGSSVTNGGYRSTRVATTLLAPAVDQCHSIINETVVNQNVNSPQINLIVRNLIGERQVVKFGNINCGNASEQHENALYQNYRLKTLFTINAEFVLGQPCPVTLCTPFQFNAFDNEGQPSVKDSGIYVTCARIIYIENANYFEKIIASRIGTNAAYYT